MRDRSNPEVIEYLKRENEYTESMMLHAGAVRERLFRELRGRFLEDDRSVPYRKGEHYYYRRSRAGHQYDIYCRALGSPDGPEEVLLDLNEYAHENEYVDLGAYEVSPDNRWLAYTLDTTGRENYTLYFRDMENGSVIDETVTNCYMRVQWAADSRTIFYTKFDRSLRPYRLCRHRLGTSQRRDQIVFEETDPAFRLTITKSRSEQFLFLRLESQITTEVHILDADRPQEPFQIVQPREAGVEYYLLHHHDRFMILTNYEAVNFRIMTTPVENPGREQWQTFLTHQEAIMIEDAEIFEHHLVLFELANGENRIQIIDMRTHEDHLVQFDEPLITCWSGRNPQFHTNVFRFVYSSLITPETVVDYNMDTREWLTLKDEEVVGGYDRSGYKAERHHATARDGTKVPISLVYKKGMMRDGSNPLLLYGYGAYGDSVEPDFWSGRLSLLDRGFIFAIAHVRGGSELGREWYEEGKLLSKMNTFTDFIACAEYLVEKQYTSQDKLVISGTSAGGLLIGTVVNMRPDLCLAAIADVPFVDVVNTMMDDTIPLTAIEYGEWGNPIEDSEVRDYLRSYSPYDNVRPAKYPNMLITAAIHDPRVHFWEPAKWAAKLRALKTDDNLLLLRTNFRSGHFGPSGRFDYLKEFAFELAFIFDVLGIEV
jgi:oligopeptidase B